MQSELAENMAAPPKTKASDERKSCRNGNVGQMNDRVCAGVYQTDNDTYGI